jgi:hypothetical protein
MVIKPVDPSSLDAIAKEKVVSNGIIQLHRELGAFPIAFFEGLCDGALERSFRM